MIRDQQQQPELQPQARPTSAHTTQAATATEPPEARVPPESFRIRTPSRLSLDDVEQLTPTSYSAYWSSRTRSAFEHHGLTALHDAALCRSGISEEIKTEKNDEKEVFKFYKASN